MKIRLLLIFFIFLSFSAFAEYNGLHFKFIIETHSGKKVVGYAYKASAYLDMDSLNSTSYLKKALDQSWYSPSTKDSLVFFKNRLRYEFFNIRDENGNPQTQYYLCEISRIALSEIVNIQIIESIDMSYTIGISNTLKPADTIWMKNKPVKTFAIEGYLCYHQIYIHQNSKKTTLILQQLIEKQKEIDAAEKMENDGEEIDWDKFDEEINLILDHFDHEKVVIITECSC